MALYELIATSAFGLESVVADELRTLGYAALQVENGRVTFGGNAHDIARCNLHLRCADRVLLKMAEFPALDFEELFQGTLRVPWEEMIPVDGKMHVIGKSVRSKLASVSDCQAIVKKAVVEAMKRRFRKDWFEERGPVYRIEVAVLKDLVTLTIDTSGDGLHKRGYRRQAGEAPLRETLAAAMVLLSRWEPKRVLADPFCGSGTIAIEAALIGRGIAPGLNRSFVSERWPQVPGHVWAAAREEARACISKDQFVVSASDLDEAVLTLARKNARSAGVADAIAFKQGAAERFNAREPFGCIVTNPPYGERMGEMRQVEELYRMLGPLFRRLDGWSMFVLTPHPDFERLFGRPADRRRKLYNGKIRCYFHQYYGPLPRKDRVPA
jgi:putative N6-adenine-specific DNA methylase